MTNDLHARCRNCGRRWPEHDELHGHCPEEIERMSEDTYLVRRFCFNDAHPDHRRVIKTGLTLEEAREHCKDDASHGEDPERGAWFDGYQEEGRG